MEALIQLVIGRKNSRKLSCGITFQTLSNVKDNSVRLLRWVEVLAHHTSGTFSWREIWRFSWPEKCLTTTKIISRNVCNVWSHIMSRNVSPVWHERKGTQWSIKYSRHTTVLVRMTRILTRGILLSNEIVPPKISLQLSACMAIGIQVSIQTYSWMSQAFSHD